MRARHLSPVEAPSPEVRDEARRLVRVFPLLRWWSRVDRGTVRADLVAGLTGAIIVLPQGMAFATIAGLPPEYGLYSAMIPAVVAALFGSSWQLVSGPTTAISIVVFAVLSPLAEPGSAEYISLALTLTFLVGVLQLAMGLARMGSLVNFISHTVVVGFTAGAAILIATSQLKHFFGIAVPRGASFHETLHALWMRAGDIDPYVTSVGAITLLTGVLVKRLRPGFPYMIAAMLAGSLAGVALTRLLGPDVAHIRTAGALPGMLPPLSRPDLSPGVVRQLGGSALALAMLALTEAISIARAIAVRSEQRLDANQEFIGQGLSNVVGSFFSSYASSGSFNRSGVNYEAGARTPLAAAFASLFLVGVVLLVAPLAAYLPVAAMAGVLFLVAWGLIDLRHIRGILRASRSETAILAATFASTLFLDLEVAIYVGVILSLAVYLNRTSRPLVSVLAPEGDGARARRPSGEGQPECSQLRIVEVHGSLFFGAVDHVEEQLQGVGSSARQKHVLVVADAINFADVAGAELLAREARRRRRLGGGLYLVGVKERTLDVLRTGGYLQEIGEENLFQDARRAVAEIRERLDDSVCQRCDRRVFTNCVDGERSGRRRAGGPLEAAITAAAFAEEGDVGTAREVLAGPRDDEREDARAEDPAPAPESPPRTEGRGFQGTGSD